MIAKYPHAEDTQPTLAELDDTQPLYAAPRPDAAGKAPRWHLLLILIFTCCGLLFTSALFMRSLPPEFWPGAVPERQVVIKQDGFITQVATRAQTIAELFDEAQINVPLDAALSHGLGDSTWDGMVITIKAARPVTIALDGQRQVLRTALDNPLQILKSAGISVAAADSIRVNGARAFPEALANWTIPAEHIEVRRPRRLTVSDSGEEATLLTTAETVGAALAEAGIELHANDISKPPPDSAINGNINGNMTVQIERAIPVALRLDGVLIEARTQARQVAEALQELDAPLFGLDYVIPSGDSEIVTDMLIEIVRVTEEASARQESIAFETRYVADSDLPLDQTLVAQAGQDGAREIRSLARYENGVEVSRQITETVVTQPPQDRLIHYGTQVNLRTLHTPEGPRQYWRVLCMLATSYHPAALGGDDVTAIGWTLRKGVVAADPKLISYRSDVYVPGYGAATMADTGGARSSRYWIDLGYSDDDWVSWRRYVKVYLLTPVPSEIDYVLPAWTPIRSAPGGCGG